MRLKNYIRRYTSLSGVIDCLKRREITLLDPQSWDDRNDRYFMEIYKKKCKLGGLYGLCAARRGETYHHWRVFTRGADGACMEIKRGPLEEKLKSTPGVYFGDVEYLKLEDAKHLEICDLNKLPFLKRWGFHPEEEYRIIAKNEKPQQTSFPIKIELEWINRIYLNPWMPPRVAESMIATLGEICGPTPIRITRSHLIDSASWKRAGDTVVGRSAATRRRKRTS